MITSTLIPSKYSDHSNSDKKCVNVCVYMHKCQEFITIGSEGAVAFASVLKKNQCLKTLYLIDDGVSVEGALKLIESLKHNTTLERLELSGKCKPP